MIFFNPYKPTFQCVPPLVNLQSKSSYSQPSQPLKDPTPKSINQTFLPQNQIHQRSYKLQPSFLTGHCFSSITHKQSPHPNSSPSAFKGLISQSKSHRNQQLPQTFFYQTFRPAHYFHTPLPIKECSQIIRLNVPSKRKHQAQLRDHRGYLIPQQKKRFIPKDLSYLFDPQITNLTPQSALQCNIFDSQIETKSQTQSIVSKEPAINSPLPQKYKVYSQQRQTEHRPSSYNKVGVVSSSKMFEDETMRMQYLPVREHEMARWRQLFEERWPRGDDQHFSRQVTMAVERGCRSAVQFREFLEQWNEL